MILPDKYASLAHEVDKDIANEGSFASSMLRAGLVRDLLDDLVGWREIDDAARNGKFQWVGRGGEFPFADWLRWNGDMWQFSDGSTIGEKYGKLLYHPLPSPPATQGQPA